jgi:hypothetical protein
MKPIKHIKYDMYTRFLITQKLKEQFEKRIEKLKLQNFIRA